MICAIDSTSERVENITSYMVTGGKDESESNNSTALSETGASNLHKSKKTGRNLNPASRGARANKSLHTKTGAPFTTKSPSTSSASPSHTPTFVSSPAVDSEATIPETAISKPRTTHAEDRGARFLDTLIGQRLRELRRSKKLTQIDLAKLLGLTFQQIQKYENGKNRISAARLWEICQLLNVDISFFFILATPPQPTKPIENDTTNKKSKPLTSPEDLKRVNKKKLLSFSDSVDIGQAIIRALEIGRLNQNPPVGLNASSVGVPASHRDASTHQSREKTSSQATQATLPTSPPNVKEDALSSTFQKSETSKNSIENKSTKKSTEHRLSKPQTLSNDLSASHEDDELFNVISTFCRISDPEQRLQILKILSILSQTSQTNKS